MKLNYEWLGPKDAYQYQQIRLKAISEAKEHIDTEGGEYRKPLLDYEDEIVKNNIIGCFDGENLIAVGKLRRSTSPNHVHKAHLESMFISSDYRGQGIAEALIRKRLNKAASLKGVEIVKMAIVQPNGKMNKLAEKFDFKVNCTDPYCWKVSGKYHAVTEYMKWMN